MSRAEFLARPEAARRASDYCFWAPSSSVTKNFWRSCLGQVRRSHFARRLLDETGGPQGLRRAGQSACVRCRESVRREPVRSKRPSSWVGALAPEPLLGLHVRSPSDIASVLSIELGQAEQEAVHVFGLDARAPDSLSSRCGSGAGRSRRRQCGRCLSPADSGRAWRQRSSPTTIQAGVATPSEEDQTLTLRLAQTGTMLSIPLLDHVIVAKSGYYSFADHGLLRSPLALPRSRSAKAISEPISPAIGTGSGPLKWGNETPKTNP